MGSLCRMSSALRAASSLLFMPAAVVPVSAQVGSVLGHDHHMSGPGSYHLLTTRTQVLLASLIGMHGGNYRRVERGRHSAIRRRPRAPRRRSGERSRRRARCRSRICVVVEMG